MADENVTASENINETTEQATTPAVKASKPAVPSPASMKPHAPSPAAFAKKAPQHTAPAAASTGFSDADVKAAEAFGRVADDGTVFVKDGEGEREVGQFPDASKEEALALYARRYLDLKAKLDLFANKLKANNVKSREIDETIKALSAETEQPAVVGDLAALKAQFEALKEEGAAKKTALTEARKAAIAKAREAAPNQPKLIKVDTLIAWPTPGKTNDPSSHGSKLGAEAVAGLKELLGYDPEESFHVDEEALAHARKVAERGLEAHKEWDEKFDAWRKANPDKAALYDRLKAGELPEGFDKAIDDLEATFEVGKGVATRGASGSVLNAIAAVMPELWGGSADLGGSNKTDLKGAATFAPAECATKQWPNCNEFGRQLHFGVREFTMGCITNGILLGSHTRPFGGTFFMFSDYERSAVRLAALMQIPNLYVWSHDSVAVGEDGPTHQPVEHLASFRAIPQLEVARPADAYETAEAYRYFFEKKNTLPTAMVLTRQGVPVLAETAEKAKDGVKKGAYVLVDTEGTPDVIIMATGSEVQWAVSAAKTLAGEGVKARVVSVPSMEWFEEQDAEYKEAVLPAAVKARVSVEAGVAMPWYKYLGSYGKPVSIEQFGLQGDGAQNMIDLGITAEHVVEAAKASIAEVEAAK